ncbi:YqzL family protein [Jeotgalibacillus marinus]|uniref:YqzL family protein n=1 Tax=Jeotgalibacillus marinus TaxID=86667 RepID=A0ABV3Q5N6_9BACL
MLDITWEVFSQTGNVELYLLLKEIEEQEVVHITENKETADFFV